MKLGQTNQLNKLKLFRGICVLVYWLNHLISYIDICRADHGFARSANSSASKYFMYSLHYIRNVDNESHLKQSYRALSRPVVFQSHLGVIQLYLEQIESYLEQIQPYLPDTVVIHSVTDWVICFLSWLYISAQTIKTNAIIKIYIL